MEIEKGRGSVGFDLEFGASRTQGYDMKTLLITGASTGFGRALTLEALNRGHQVALAVRNPESVADLVAQFPGKAHSLSLIHISEPTRPY